MLKGIGMIFTLILPFVIGLILFLIFPPIGIVWILFFIGLAVYTWNRDKINGNKK